MLRYKETKIVFSEIPNEISLAIGICECPFRCLNCHSKHLWDYDGEALTVEVIDALIKSNPDITTVCLMGGDADPIEVGNIVEYIKRTYPYLKTAWYSGAKVFYKELKLFLKYFDYIKIGPYIEELGPLTSKTTNQRLYKIVNNEFIDITDNFWK